ncbi:MAG: glutamate-cysteine ligase family protein [Planctomycetota bacterium]|jgi:hypothetical protein
MSVFDPRTFSTDWEVMVIDRLDRSVDTGKCDAFAGALRAELDLPIHTDWNAIEFGMGVNSSFEQFRDRIFHATDRAAELVREFDLDLFPFAAHPHEPMFNASHIHVGSIHDEVAATRLENRMTKYTPAFAALAANSPFHDHRRGEFKSYRVRHLAHGAIRPSSVRDPCVSQIDWGADASSKIPLRPTMEVRIVDCASSRLLLAEMGTFIAAFLHHQGENVDETVPGRDEYREALTNRWAAAKHGMQATFIWEGGTRPVTEVVDAMLDSCSESLAKLGAKRKDFRLINTMIRKRVCQADLGLEVASRYPDPYLLTSAYSKLVRHWDIFDEYLGRAKALSPVPAPDEEAILNEHLALVGEGTHFCRLHEAMYYPAPLTEEIIERMIEKGLVAKEVSAERGLLLHRLR